MHTPPGRKNENKPQGHRQSRGVKQNTQILSLAQHKPWLLSKLPKEATILIRQAGDYIWGAETVQVILLAKAICHSIARPNF